ncbi:hypothetical protein IKF34_03110 [Candidatus Saccharibacteria bacterium]|nr:hypothetical protein [Candidatus Saccharibacteria bacterium]
MGRKLENKLTVALTQIEEGFYDPEDVKLIEDHLIECLAMSNCDATHIADIIDSEKVIEYYDELVAHGAKINPQSLMFDMDCATAWRHIDWLAASGIHPDIIARYFQDDVYNPAYKPIDLEAKLLQIGASKHLVFDIFGAHLRSLVDTPERLMHNLGVLIENGIDRFRIMFWIEKYVPKESILKYAEKWSEFGINPDFHEEDLREEYGVELDARDKELMEEYFHGASC